MKQNITISLDKDLIRKARIIAVQRRISISGMLAEELKRIVDDTESYERAEAKALEHLDTGFRLGVGIPVSREDLHER